MKQFIVDRHTTPATPTLEQVPTEKVRVYETKDALYTDLSNISEDEIVMTKDTGDESNSPIDSVTAASLRPVTSHAVAAAFNGMEVEESGYIDPNYPQNGWYTKYACGIIVEDFILSHPSVAFTARGSLYISEKSVDIPVALKANTQPIVVNASVKSVYSAGKNGVWVACTNEGSDSNTKVYYQLVSHSSGNTTNMIVRFHVVGWWK